MGLLNNKDYLSEWLPETYFWEAPAFNTNMRKTVQKVPTFGQFLFYSYKVYIKIRV